MSTSHRHPADPPTPLEAAPIVLAEFTRRESLWLKREDAHELGVFKWRGALPVVTHHAAEGHRAIVTCSTGNHGAAVAWACKRMGMSAIVFVPEHAVALKLARVQTLGAEVRVAGEDFDESKDAAARFARAQGLPFFEDGAEPLQYTAYEAIGEEILEQAPIRPALVLIPVGNGALAGGVGTAIARHDPTIRRVGVVAEAMPVMAESYEAGRPTEVQPGQTIADGLAVRVAIPFAVQALRHALDAMLRVSEDELAEALLVCHAARVEIEPAAAATVAALRRHGHRLEGGPTVLVITGRNFDSSLVARMSAGRPH